MAEIRSVCVYCGSGPGHAPEYEQAAAAFGVALAKAGIRLVYGGGGTGLMGTVATAVLKNGGHVTGVIPQFLKSRELQMQGLQEQIVVDDMQERKMIMYQRSDAFVALPGGIGTLEELVEQLTWVQLGRHRKPVVVLNTLGFWDPLRVLLTHMKTEGFIRPQFEVTYQIAQKVEEVIPLLREQAAKVPEGGLDAADQSAIARL
jgi:uncharacterized protein (TIGR00730 family)